MNHVCGLLLGVMAFAPVSHVANSSFESVDEPTNMPTGWQATHVPGQPELVSYAVKAMPARPATKALAIHVAADHPEKQVAYNVWQDLADIQPGKSYQLTAQVQTRGLTTLPVLVVQCLDDSGRKYLGFGRSPDRTLKADVTEWETISTELEIPEGTSTVRLRIGIPAAGNQGGTAMIDEVRVKEMQ